MIKQLAKHGNSLALVVDKAILELLHIDADTPLEVSTDGHSLIVTPAPNATSRKAFRAALKRVNKQHAKALNRLAE